MNAPHKKSHGARPVAFDSFSPCSAMGGPLPPTARSIPASARGQTLRLPPPEQPVLRPPIHQPNLFPLNRGKVPYQKKNPRASIFLQVFLWPDFRHRSFPPPQGSKRDISPLCRRYQKWGKRLYRTRETGPMNSFVRLSNWQAWMTSSRISFLLFPSLKIL